MKHLTSDQIRQIWLDFFISRGHYQIPSASLIPDNDPTLLWINSGVAALKKYFDGRTVPDKKRLTNVQKSIRTNDINQVGYTARHHTFFEMLGNFSLGDYFRQEIIQWAYQILTNKQYFGLDPRKLYMTYNPSDVETKSMWIKQGIKEDNLIPLKSNFWEIGEGPCGPNTEVFYDRGVKYDPHLKGVSLLKEEIENDRYIELWGIVFSQYNAISGKKRDEYEELPNKNIDTGAGLERLACVIQETESNFETDLFLPIIRAVEKISSKPYSEQYHRPYRVIVDHIRTLVFALSDGAYFSNEGRGYVLRRLLRRALRYGRKIDIERPFLHELIGVVAKINSTFYPYLEKEVDRVSKIVKAEEQRFLATLVTGETMLRQLINDNHQVTAEQVFKLYDTYGFPFELTKEIAEENGISIDKDGFDKLMEKQRQRARRAMVATNSMKRQSPDMLKFLLPSNFSYDSRPIKAKVIGTFINGEMVNRIDTNGEIVVDTTNFYAESGGQVADTGYFENDTTRLEVTNVMKGPHDQHFHHIDVIYGSVEVGDVLTGHIDENKRQLTMANHTSLHLLQRALIDVLGPHVKQMGSFVNHEYGRFDFSHPERVNHHQLMEIENMVNKMIKADYKQEAMILPIKEAKKLNAISLFDEKYKDEVRVVTFGDVSKEFCGGTHVESTGQLKVFTIVSEESIASGIRRIVSYTGIKAHELIQQKETMLNNIRHQLQANSNREIKERIKSLHEEKQRCAKQMELLINEKVKIYADKGLSDLRIVNDVSIAFTYYEHVNKEILLKIFDMIKNKNQANVIVLIGEKETTYPFIVYLDKLFINRGLHAGNIAKEIANILSGSGGGKDNLAFGAGSSINNIDDVYKYITDLIS
jgi:alanyl-tRNA synthetase